MDVCVCAQLEAYVTAISSSIAKDFFYFFCFFFSPQNFLVESSKAKSKFRFKLFI